MVEPVLPRYLTTAEVADYLRLKPRKVYDLVRQGHTRGWPGPSV